MLIAHKVSFRKNGEFGERRRGIMTRQTNSWFGIAFLAYLSSTEKKKKKKCVSLLWTTPLF